MCLAIPGRLQEIHDAAGVGMVRVNVGDIDEASAEAS